MSHGTDAQGGNPSGGSTGASTFSAPADSRQSQADAGPPADADAGTDADAPMLGCTQPPPSNVRASSAGSVRVALTWSPSSPPAYSYAISRSTVSGGGYGVIGTVPGTNSYYLDDDATLRKDTEYYYQVTAVGTCSSPSTEVSAKTACAAPSPPQNLSVANSNGSITATWDPVAGATGYAVARDTRADGNFADAVTLDQPTTSYLDQGSSLVNGVTYYYKVSASNAGGQCASASSDTRSAMSCAPPDVPGSLAASVGLSRQIKLRWAASAGAAQYRLVRRTTGTPDTTLAPATGTSYTDTGLTDGRTYSYKVSAQNGTANACSSPASNEINAVPKDCLVLAASQTGYGPPNPVTAYCFVTCWDIATLGVSNFSGRTLTINDTALSCQVAGDGTGLCGIPSPATKDFDLYPKSGAYLFNVTNGSLSYPTVYWTGSAKNCE